VTFALTIIVSGVILTAFGIYMHEALTRIARRSCCANGSGNGSWSKQMTSPSLAEENRERAQIMKEEAARRDQERASTMLDHAQSAINDEHGGRFARIQPQMIVVGADPIPNYPAAGSPWQGPDLVGQEPPLGYSVDDLEAPIGALVSPPIATGPADSAPSPFVEGDDVQRSDAGPPSSETKQKG
jgi:hypothetical protein